MKPIFLPLKRNRKTIVSDDWYVARDEDGSLTLFDEMPEKVIVHYPETPRGWYRRNGARRIALDYNLFPEIRFNDGPKRVRIEITPINAK